MFRIILAACCAAAVAMSASIETPLSKREFFESLEKSQPDQLFEQVRKRGVSFRLRGDEEGQAMQAGADYRLLLAIATKFKSDAETEDDRRIRLAPTLSTNSVTRDVSPVAVLKQVPPHYPPNARRGKIQGRVELAVTISTEGKPSDVKILSGHPQLAMGAIDAVKQWTYKPAISAGKPILGLTYVVLNFSLQ